MKVESARTTGSFDKPSVDRQVNQETKQNLNDEQEKAVKLSREKVEKALVKVKQSIEIFDKRLHFKIHEETKQVQVQVIDRASGEVVDEIPPEKILDLLAAIQQFTGLLVDVKA